MKRYRYISNGCCMPNDKLSDFRLIGSFKDINPSSVIRVTIPDSIELEHWAGDGYSTTKSNVKIKNLHPVVIVRYNSKMKPNLELTKDWLDGKVEPHQFHTWMAQKGYKGLNRFGYITQDQYKWYWNMEDPNKLWQIDKMPNLNETFNFIPENEYQTRFCDYIAEIKKAIKTNKEVSELVKNLHISDIELFDRYAMYCFSNHCDTKLNHIDFEFKNYKPFLFELKLHLRSEARIRAIENK